ncbi:MAG: HPr family phosphocarrier protein [Deltaproteobacteria bacterium]|nr:HPr family phosphocarrier protein [Deltaproteobacteria bacterium]
MEPGHEQEGAGAGSLTNRTCTIKNKLGLHARAAALFVQTAARFPCEIFLARDGNEVNGKSIMGILTLAASKGTQVTLRASGAEASAAVARLCELIENKFGEE